MMPMNNPMVGLLNIARSGGNPMLMIQQMAQGNPQVAGALQMMRGKNASQLQQMAQNMAQERGLNLDQMMQQMGIKR